MDSAEGEIWRMTALQSVDTLRQFEREIHVLRAYAAALRKGDEGEVEATWRELCAESQRVIERGGA